MTKQFGDSGPRTLYPDICTSKSLASCSLKAQLLFDRLIVQVDDQGRMLGDPGVVKAKCVPLLKGVGAKSVARALRELAAVDCIILYQVDQRELLQLANWWNYQNGLRRAYASRWPAPPDWLDGAYGYIGDGIPESKPAGLRFGRQHSARRLPAESQQSAVADSASCVTSSDPIRIPSDSDPIRPDPTTIRSDSRSDGGDAGQPVSRIGKGRKDKGVSGAQVPKKATPASHEDQKPLLEVMHDFPDLLADPVIVDAYKEAVKQGISRKSIHRTFQHLAPSVRADDPPVDLKNEFLRVAMTFEGQNDN